MDGEKRREKLVKMLKETKTPISGGAFSKALNVSRQIVVGDIALLRASGTDIIATNSGYILNEKNGSEVVTVKVRHKTMDAYDVLCTMVDEGVKITSVYVMHGAFGKLEVPLDFSSRSDIRTFSEKMLNAGERTLGELTNGIHYYTIASDNQVALLRAQKALNDKGYIIK